MGKIKNLIRENCIVGYFFMDGFDSINLLIKIGRGNKKLKT